MNTTIKENQPREISSECEKKKKGMDADLRAMIYETDLSNAHNFYAHKMCGSSSHV